MIRKFAAPIEQLVLLNPKLSPLKNEDWLNLEMDDVDQPEGQKRLGNSQTNLLLKNACVDVDIASISRTEMNKLYNEVSVHTTPQKKCLTGLTIYHAAEEGPDGKCIYNPVYQAVFLKRIRPDYPSHSYIYNITERGDFYMLSSAGKFMSCADPEPFKKCYRDHADICPDYEEPAAFRGFIRHTDTESVLFPFQLIYTLMEHNGNDTVLLHQCLSGSNDSTDVPLMHSILLSSKLITNTGLFAGKFANRSHLCPPCLADFGFNLTY